MPLPIPMPPAAGLPGKPSLPGNMAGGPVGPGASPALAPGDGAGNSAAASAMVKAVIPALMKAMSAFPPGSKEFQALHRAIGALGPLFNREQQSSMVPAALLQMAQAAKGSTPMTQAPPPGIAPAPPPPTPGAPPPGGADAMAA